MPKKKLKLSIGGRAASTAVITGCSRHPQSGVGAAKAKSIKVGVTVK